MGREELNYSIICGGEVGRPFRKKMKLNVLNITIWVTVSKSGALAHMSKKCYYRKESSDNHWQEFEAKCCGYKFLHLMWKL